MSKLIDLKKLSTCGLLGIMMSSTLAIDSNAAPIIDPPSPPVPTRALVNPSFELPYFPNANAAWISLDNYIPGNENTLQGWFSTHPKDFPNSNKNRYKHPDGTQFQHVIELWANGHSNVHSPAGTQHIELNASANSAVYQDILVFQGEQIPWSVNHRGRTSGTIPDIAEVFISEPSDWTGATFNGTRLYSSHISTSNNGSISQITPVTGNVANSNSMNALSNGWVQYSDVWSGPSVSKKYRFAFQAISSARGNSDSDLTYGNLLDNIQIQLSPIVDLVNPNISEIHPLKDSIYYLPVRINGQAESTATVEIDVTLAGEDYTSYSLEALMSGSNTAVQNGITATKLDNGNIQVSVPPELYDPNNPSHYINVPINFDQVLSARDLVATFTVTDVNGGGGQEVQNLLIPPSDSGFETELETTVLASVFAD